MLCQQQEIGAAFSKGLITRPPSCGLQTITARPGYFDMADHQRDAKLITERYAMCLPSIGIERKAMMHVDR